MATRRSERSAHCRSVVSSNMAHLSSPIPHPPSLVSHLPSLIDQLARLVLCGPVAVDCLPACLPRAEHGHHGGIDTGQRDPYVFWAATSLARSESSRRLRHSSSRTGSMPSAPLQHVAGSYARAVARPMYDDMRVPMVWLFGAASLSIERERWDAQAVEAAAAAAAAPSMAPLLGKPGVPALDD